MHQVLNVFSNLGFFVTVLCSLFLHRQIPQRFWVFRILVFYVGIASMMYHGSRAADDANENDTFTDRAGWMDVASVISLLLWMLYQSVYATVIADPEFKWTWSDAVFAAAAIIIGHFYAELDIPWPVLYTAFFVAIGLLCIGVITRVVRRHRQQSRRCGILLGTACALCLAGLMAWIHITNDGDPNKCPLNRFGHALTHILESILLLYWYVMFAYPIHDSKRPIMRSGIPEESNAHSLLV